MAPLINDELMTIQGDGASNGDDGMFASIAAFVITTVFFLSSVILLLLCTCGGKKEEGVQEGKKGKEELLVPPSTSQTGPPPAVSGKGSEPSGPSGTASGIAAPSPKSARKEMQTKKISLTPPGATCPPQYMPDDEDKTVNVEGLVKKAPA